MDVNQRFVEIVAWPLRLLHGAAALVCFGPGLLRRSDACVKELDALDGFIRNEPVPWWKQRWNQIVIPIGDYSALWPCVLRLIRGDGFEHWNRVEKARSRTLEIAASLATGRTFLLTREARHLQTRYIRIAFWNLLRIRLENSHALAMSLYAEASEAMRDFLDYCEVTASLNSRNSMTAALASFSQILEPRRYQRLESERDGPQPGEICERVRAGKPDADGQSHGRPAPVFFPPPPESHWSMFESAPETRSPDSWTSQFLEEGHSDWIRECPRTLRGAFHIALSYRNIVRLTERVDSILGRASDGRQIAVSAERRWRNAIQVMRD